MQSCEDDCGKEAKKHPRYLKKNKKQKKKKSKAYLDQLFPPSTS